MTDTSQVSMLIEHLSGAEIQDEVFNIVLAHMAARALMERAGLDKRDTDAVFANKLNSILEFKVHWKDDNGKA